MPVYFKSIVMSSYEIVQTDILNKKQRKIELLIGTSSKAKIFFQQEHYSYSYCNVLKKTNSWISASAQFARTSLQSLKNSTDASACLSNYGEILQNCHCSPMSLSDCQTMIMMRSPERTKNQIFSGALMWTGATVPTFIC